MITCMCWYTGTFRDMVPKLHYEVLQIFFDSLMLGPNSRYGSIYCADTHTITFRVSAEELVGMERWREDITEYTACTGFLYFYEHHTPLPLRVKLDYTSFVTFPRQISGGSGTYLRYCAKPAQWYSDLAADFPQEYSCIRVVGASNPSHVPLHGVNPILCSSYIEPMYMAICARQAATIDTVLLPRAALIPYSYMTHIMPLTISQWRNRTRHL
jgi:hypothetical protein